MKNLVVFLTLSLTSTLVLADNNSYYVKGGLSYSSPETQPETNVNFTKWDFDSGLGINLALGKRYSDKLAIELELQHKKFDAKTRITNDGDRDPLDGDISYTSAFVNMYYYPQLEAKSNLWNPYAGAGLGVSKVSWNKLDIVDRFDPLSDSDTVASFQVILGNRFELKNNWFVDAEYRYFKTDDYNIYDQDEEGQFTNSNQHSLVLSVVRNF